MEIWNDPERSVAERLDSLLAELTTAEKIGQLGSFWPRPAPQAAGDRKRNIDEVAPLQSAFEASRVGFDRTAEHGLGQLTRVFGTAPVSAADGAERLAGHQRE